MKRLGFRPVGSGDTVVVTWASRVTARPLRVDWRTPQESCLVMKWMALVPYIVSGYTIPASGGYVTNQTKRGSVQYSTLPVTADGKTTVRRNAGATKDTVEVQRRSDFRVAVRSDMLGRFRDR